VGKFFVAREIQADYRSDVSGRFGFGGFGGFLFGCGGRLRGGVFFGVVVCCLGVFAFVFEDYFFAQAVALDPVLYFASGLLGGVFIFAKIENQEVVGHATCIAGFERVCQATADGRRRN
jgi:hypothetical protein